MAELEQTCCSQQTQDACCEPVAKAECCGPQHGSGCGCGASATATGTPTDVREAVREKYAAYAIAAPGTVVSPADREGAFGAALYEGSEAGATEVAVSASLGCGVPTAVAELHEGETVLDVHAHASVAIIRATKSAA